MFQQVQKVIAEQLNIDVDRVKPESRLIEDLEADSLDVVELVTELEMNYDIEIPDEAMTTLATVQDVVNYIEANKK
ncbi:MAG: acyl carrier protein [Christensenellales bacterium]|jgi:acyl carrier protein